MLKELMAAMAAVIAFFMFFLAFTKKRYVFIYFIVLALLLGPRIPFLSVSETQRIDVRFDDLFIIIMFPVGLVYMFLKRPRFPKYMYVLLAYSIITFLTTAFAGLRGDTSFDKALLFFGKETEYLSLAFMVPMFLKDDDDLKQIFKCAAIGIGVNIVWLFVQFYKGKGQLVKLVDIPSYGFTMISESHPFQVGAIYSYALLLFAVCFFVYRKNTTTLVLIFCSLLGLLSTLSRTFILTTVIGFFLLSMLLLLTKKTLTAKNFLLLCAVYIIAIIVFLNIFKLLEALGLPVFRVQAGAASDSLTVTREEDIWAPLWGYFLKNPLMGYGKGSVGQLIWTDEAHNYYLRLLIESGIAGAGAFVLFLAMVMKDAFLFFKRPGISPERRVVALFMVLLTANIVTAALGQDAFYSSKVALTYYLGVGLFAYVQITQPAADAAAARERTGPQPAGALAERA